MNTIEYTTNDPVMGPLIYSGSFFKSNTAAIGIPKLETGPQKWVVNTYLIFCLLKILRKDMFLQKDTRLWITSVFEFLEEYSSSNCLQVHSMI